MGGRKTGLAGGCGGDVCLNLDSFNGDGECLGSLSSFFIFRVRCRIQHMYMMGIIMMTAAIGAMISANFVPIGIPVSPVAAPAAADDDAAAFAVVDALVDASPGVAVDGAVIREIGGVVGLAVDLVMILGTGPEPGGEGISVGIVPGCSRGISSSPYINFESILMKVCLPGSQSKEMSSLRRL